MKKIIEKANGNYKILVVGMLLATFIPYFTNQLFYGIALSNMFLNSLLSLALKIFYIMLMNTMYFMFVVAIRNQEISTKNIVRESLRQWKVHIITGLLTALIEVSISTMAGILFASIPALLIVFTIFFQLYMVLVKGMIAFAIFDENTSYMEIFTQSFRIVAKNWKQYINEGRMLIVVYVLWQFMYAMWLLAGISLVSDHMLAQSVFIVVTMLCMVVDAFVIAFMQLLNVELYNSQRWSYFPSCRKTA